MSMTVIEHIEVGSGGTALIVLDEIPDTYTDLYLVVSARTDRSSGALEDSLQIQFNGTAFGYTNTTLYGNGSSVASSNYNPSAHLIRLIGATDGATSSTFGNSALVIPNYAGSNTKSVSMDAVSENNGTEAWFYSTAGHSSLTAAINQISLSPLVGTTILEFSSATLYGITAGSDGTTTVS